MLPGEAQLLRDAFQIKLVCSGTLSDYPLSVRIEVGNRAAATVAAHAAPGTSGALPTVVHVSAVAQNGYVQLEITLHADDDQSAAEHVAQLQPHLGSASKASSTLGVTVMADPWIHTALVHVYAPPYPPPPVPPAPPLPPPHPPSPPPLPLSPPWASIVPSNLSTSVAPSATTFAFTASGEVSDYDEPRRASIAGVLASAAAVSTDDVTLSIVAASVSILPPTL